MRSVGIVGPTLWLSWAACTPNRVDVNSAPSILLVTINNLRADHVGAYDSETALTPTLDRLAATGTMYARAYTSSPQSIPAHATLFTGKHPPAHGVRDDGDFSLGDEQITIAERLRAQGYATAAVVSSFTSRRRWGLAQGFEIYREPPTPRRSASNTDQRPADETVDEALATLAAMGADRPVFLWVHFYDPHFPYDPPPQWAAMFPDRPYDGEIAFVDDELGRLLVGWETRFGTERSVVAVTSPHGESLGEGGEASSGFLLNDATLRVPLVVRGPGMEPGVTIHDPVGLVDVAPTLLDLSGVGLHRGLQGDDLRDGGSDAIYSESLVGMYNLGLAPLYALTETNGRYVSGAWGAFYPAFADQVIDEPFRMDPRGPNAVQMRKERLWLGETHAPEVGLDPQTLAMLSALGYVGGNAKASAGTIDPRDVVAVLPKARAARRMIDIGMNQRARSLLDELEQSMPDAFGVRLMEAQLLYRQGRLAEADRAFQNLFQAHPSPTVAHQLAAVAIARARWYEAADWYDTAYWLDPANPETRAGLVRCAYVLGDHDLALDRYAEMVAQMPDDPQTVLIGAELALRDLQPAAALPMAMEALDQMPASPWAHAVYGRVLWDLGHPDDAIDALQDALRLDPYPAPIRIELVSNLLEIGRTPEAVRVSAPMARMLADHPAAQEVYRLTRENVSDLDWRKIRRDRARGPDGLPVRYRRKKSN